MQSVGIEKNNVMSKIDDRHVELGQEFDNVAKKQAVYRIDNAAIWVSVVFGISQ